jgi:hypothetical protein
MELPGNRKPGMRACLYLFFDYSEMERQSPANMLACLLRQVVRSRDHTSADLQEAFDDHHHGQDLSQAEYVRLLKSEIEPFTEIFLVIDALDECPDEKGGKSREIFLNAIFQLPENVKFFFTSRNLKSIGDTLNADIQVRITAREDELRNYIESRLDGSEALEKLVALRGQKHANFRDKFIKTIVEKSQKT